jgi:hypothetical protein
MTLALRNEQASDSVMLLISFEKVVGRRRAKCTNDRRFAYHVYRVALSFLYLTSNKFGENFTDDRPAFLNSIEFNKTGERTTTEKLFEHMLGKVSHAAGVAIFIRWSNIIIIVSTRQVRAFNLPKSVAA